MVALLDGFILGGKHLGNVYLRNEKTCGTFKKDARVGDGILAIPPLLHPAEKILGQFSSEMFSNT